MRRYVLVLACLLTLAIPAAAGANEWNAFATPSAPHSVAVDGDGTLWYAAAGGVLGSMDPVTGAATEVDDPAVGSVGEIEVAPDGRVWFTDAVNDIVWRYDPTVPGLAPITVTGAPWGIALSGGTMWVTRNAVDLVTPIDAVTGAPGTAVSTGLATGPQDIAADEDGNLWFLSTSIHVSKLAAGAVTSYPIAAGGGRITLGPDGAMWFTQPAADSIGRVNDSGAVTEYTLPAGTDTPLGIVSGPDNALWFTEQLSNRVSRMTTGGTVTRWLTPGVNGGASESGEPQGIASDGVDRLWFADAGGTALGFITTAVGPAGPEGPEGPAGPEGPEGPEGPAGPEGPEGPAGDDGPQGPPGDDGAQGPSGPTGPGGPQGATGPQGAAGLPGARGQTGPQGARGRRGRRGKRGRTGKTPKVRCGTRGADRRVRCRVVVGGGEARAALRLRLSRRGKLYATGARIARRRRTNVRLHALRRIRPGRYRLLVVVGDDIRFKVRVRVR